MVRINGRDVDLAPAFPLTIGDIRALKAKDIDMMRSQKCGNCAGSGRVNELDGSGTTGRCVPCGGSGQVVPDLQGQGFLVLVQHVVGKVGVSDDEFDKIPYSDLPQLAQEVGRLMSGTPTADPPT